MAEINITTKIETAEAAKGLKDLRTSLRDLVSAQSQVGAGTAEFTKLQNAINKTENKLSDLTDAFGTLKGSGVDRLNSSFSLLREGFASADPGKVTIGMQGLGAAMKAIPIFLIIEGIKFLVESFDKLKGSGGLVGEAIGWISEQISAAIAKLKEFSDWIGLTSFAVEEAAKKEVEAARMATEAITGRYDLEIRLAKAAGKETEEQEKKKIDAVRKSIEAQMAALVQLRIANGISQEEFAKQNAELTKTYNKLAEDKLVIDAELKKKQSDAAKQKAIDDAKIAADLQARNAALQNYYIDKEQTDFEAAILRETARDEAVAKLSKDELDKRLKTENDAEINAYNEHIKREFDKARADEQAAQESLAAHLKAQELKFQATKQGLQAGQAVSDFIFQSQLRKVKGNAEAELKIKKNQFNVEKGLKIANIAMDTASAIVKTTAQLGGVGALTPAGIALLVGIGVLGAAQAAIVAGTKFEGGEVSADTPALSSGGGGGGSAASENIGSTPGPAPQFNPNSVETNAKDGRVWVLEVDIRKVMNKVSVIENRATFP